MRSLEGQRGTFAPLEGQGRFLRVLLDFTDRCNLKCVMYHFSLPGYRQGQVEISHEELERVAPELLPHAQHLGLSCATEPFMNRDFMRVMETVARHEVPWVYYVTNGTLLTDEAVEATLRCGIDLVILSLDGATRETFESIRRNARFDKVLANMRRLRDAKRAAGTGKPRLQYNLTLLRSNVDELEDWLRLVAELGAQDIDLRHAVPYAGLATRSLSLFDHRELANRALGRAREVAAELGLRFVSIPDDFTLESPASAAASELESATEAEPLQAPPASASPPSVHLREPCPMPWTMVLVHPDGNVMPCTNWYTHEPMGNIKEQTFAEIWNGPKLQELRRQLLALELGANCRVCPSLGLGSVDREESFEAREV